MKMKNLTLYRIPSPNPLPEGEGFQAGFFCTLALWERVSRRLWNEG
jgi:hypothetical protein